MLDFNNPAILIGIAIGLYFLLDRVIPKFRFRRRIFSGLIALLLIRAILLIIGPRFNLDTSFTNEVLAVAVISAVAGAIVREYMEGRIK